MVAIMSVVISAAEARAEVESRHEVSRQELARRHLLDCCQYCIPGFIPDYPHQVLCEELEKVERGETKRLIVCMLPQYGKSTIISHMFPAWYLARNPRNNVMLSSYDEKQTLKNSRKARDLFVSPAFGRLFPEMHHRPGRESQRRIPVEKQAASEWGTVLGGTLYGASVNSGLTGQPSDLSIIDDPTKDHKDADSPVVQADIADWFWGVLYMRRSSPETPIVLVQTRWNLYDLAGQLIESMKAGGEEWKVVSMPAILDEGLPTQRALSPLRWPLDEVLRLQGITPPRTWTAVQMQNPTPSGGLVYSAEWWNGRGNRYDITAKDMITRCKHRALSFDTASETGIRNDYTAMTVGELSPENKLAIREVWRDKKEFTELLGTVIGHVRRYQRDGKLCAILIENANSGRQLIQTLRAQAPPDIARLVYGVPTVRGNAPADRSQIASTWCCNGSVFLPEKSEATPWLEEFERELFTYPAAAHDDQVASFSQLVWYWRHYLSAGLGTKLV